MKTSTLLKSTRCQRQRGAVAITFALSLLVLIGFMALVFDLGRTYVVRTELQNAADAAALAGAKDLNQKLAGVTQAIATVKAMGLQNNTKFSFKGDAGIVITDAMIWVGSCPDDGCMEAASSVISDALAADKTFLKVDIPSGGLATFFARVPTTMAGTGTQETRTYGRAVAGKYLVDITPLGICSLDNTAVDLGYERGVSYNIDDTNAAGLAPGAKIWIDPVARTSPECDGSTPALLPYTCAGKIAFTPILDGNFSVYTNTGVSQPNVEALNSRFGVFNSQNKCDATTAPPDTNIKEYIAKDLIIAGSPGAWMSPAPTKQSLTFIDIKKQHVPKPVADREIKDYGVLWSASRPVGKTVSDWSSLYGGAATDYPETSPYSQSSPPFFSPGTNGKSGRRMLHLFIIDCRTVGGQCRKATVLGIGKYFMQKMANASTDVHVEFAGLTQIPPSEIRLYR